MGILPARHGHAPEKGCELACVEAARPNVDDTSECGNCFACATVATMDTRLARATPSQLVIIKTCDACTRVMASKLSSGRTMKVLTASQMWMCKANFPLASAESGLSALWRCSTLMHQSHFACNTTTPTHDARRPIHSPIPASCCCKLPSLHSPPSPATLVVFQPALRVQFGAPRSSRPAVARRHHISPPRRGARMIPIPPPYRLYIIPLPPLLIDSAIHLSPPNGEPPTFLHTTTTHHLA